MTEESDFDILDGIIAGHEAVSCVNPDDQVKADALKRIRALAEVGARLAGIEPGQGVWRDAGANPTTGIHEYRWTQAEGGWQPTALDALRQPKKEKPVRRRAIKDFEQEQE